MHTIIILVGRLTVSETKEVKVSVTGAGSFLSFCLAVLLIIWFLIGEQRSLASCHLLYDNALTRTDSMEVDTKHVGPYFIEPCIRLVAELEEENENE